MVDPTELKPLFHEAIEQMLTIDRSAFRSVYPSRIALRKMKNRLRILLEELPGDVMVIELREALEE